MLRVNGADFATAVRLLAGMRAWLKCDSSMGTGNPALLGFLIGEHVRGAVEGLPVSQTVKNQLITLQADALRAADTPEHCRALGTKVEVFLDSLGSELENLLCLVVDADKKELFDQASPQFGLAVDERFPQATPDVASAARCLALGEWTAAVFHLMRVLEHGLRWMAADAGIPMSGEMDEQWKTLIDRILAEIGRIEGQPKTPDKSARLRYYSSAAVDLRNFKNAWRNDVSHSRVTYDEREAIKVWAHVRAFMQDLAVWVAN